jgi:hypothetical protein
VSCGPNYDLRAQAVSDGSHGSFTIFDLPHLDGQDSAGLSAHRAQRPAGVGSECLILSTSLKDIHALTLLLTTP